MRCPIAVTALLDVGGPAPDLSLVITGAGEVKTVTPLSMFTGFLLMSNSVISALTATLCRLSFLIQ